MNQSQTVDKEKSQQSFFDSKVKLPKGGKKWYNIDIEMSDKNDDQKRKYREVQYDIFNSRRASSPRP